MTPDAVTLVATSFLVLGCDEERIPAILNSNIPTVGGGEITNFTPDHVKEIMEYAQLNQPEWYQGLKDWDRRDENIENAVEFLKFGGIKDGRVVIPDVGADHVGLKTIARSIILAGSETIWSCRAPDSGEIPIGAETMALYDRCDSRAAPIRRRAPSRPYVYAGCYEVCKGRGQYIHYHSGEGPHWAPGGKFGPGGMYPPPPGYGSNNGVCGGSLKPTGRQFAL